jgi:hypothetical protein
MRYASMVFAAAVSCLVGGFANPPAQAAVFDFSFISTLPAGTFGSGSATGTFATGAASPIELGYDLLTSLTFATLSGVAPPPFSFSDPVTTLFPTGAAFNPTTDAFINHSGGGTFANYGGTTFALLGGRLLEINGRSFSLGSGELSGTLPSGIGFSIGAPLVITQVDLGDDARWVRRPRLLWLSSNTKGPSCDRVTQR